MMTAHDQQFRRLRRWLISLVLPGWAIASCTFPEYTFSPTDAGLGAGVICKNDGGDCQAASCTNRLKDGAETDVDCGGDCNACEVGKGCALGADCKEGVCLLQVCAPPACDDRVKNATESDVDCGGPQCPKCAADQHCVTPTDCISGDCAKGACTPTCADGLASCDGDSTNGCETNVRTDPNHCGGCATTCKLPNATADCSGSICRVASCADGFADCNGDPMDGCEINTKTDKVNCGTCGKACPSVNGQPYCAEAACQITCDAGFGDCDNDRANGCEKDVSRDVQNCGKCGTLCTPTQGGTPWCKNNICGETVCPGGKGDCNGDPADGCETDLTTDAKNCKTCGNLCVVSNGTATCNNTVCAIATCTAPYDNCVGGYADGCETNTDTDLGHCGKCGNSCSVANGSAKCVTGMCGVKSCTSPNADCNGLPGDGCEVNLSNNQTSCGGCGAAGKNCNNAYGNATSHCQSSGCAFDTCAANYDNCNTDLGDGCEANLKADKNHCGICTTACATTNASSASCNMGTCLPVCAGTFLACSNPQNGCTTNSATDKANCSGCGKVCDETVAAHVSSNTCAASACSPSCVAPWDTCDTNKFNGCETDTSSSRTNCGGCGKVCDTTPPAHVTTNDCMGGQCDPKCSGLWANCDGNKQNGCEKPVDGDGSNCGGCGVICATAHAVGGTSCGAGACHPICDAGWKDCTNSAAGCTTQLGTALNCLSCGNACAGATPFCTASGCADHLDITVVNSGLGFVSGTPSSSCPAAAFCWDGSKAPIATTMHGLATASGNYRMVVVGVASQLNLREPVSVTYNGAPMTFIVRQGTSEDRSWAGVYYILESALPVSGGTYPVTVNWSNGMLWGSGIFDVVELKNVHQTNPFVTTASVDIAADCPAAPGPRALTINFAQAGSFVYALTAAANGAVGGGLGMSSTPVGYVQTLNLGAGFPNPAFLAGMAGYVGPVASSQTFTWNVANCYNSASVGVVIRRMGVP
jgi:hypothetical protein